MTTLTAEAVTAPSVETRPTMRELRIADRCDTCQAQAYVIATNANHLNLLFCGHHGNEFTAKLIAQGFTVDNRSELINKKPSQSSV